MFDFLNSTGNMRFQKGFTLIEVLIATVVIGIISLILIPSTQSLFSAKHQHYIEKENHKSVTIAKSLLQYADSRSGDEAARLPDPYTGDGYFSSIVNLDPASAHAKLREIIMLNGISPMNINDDDTAGRSVRVFQKIAIENESVPFYSNAPLPEVDISYDYGVVYMTACSYYDSSCNDAPLGGHRDEISDLVDVDENWLIDTEDLAPYMISTRDLQNKRLRGLEDQVRTIREHIVAEHRARQRNTDAEILYAVQRVHPDNDEFGGSMTTTDWKNAIDAGVSASFSNDAFNCFKLAGHDYWYDLGDSSNDLLSYLGLDVNVYGDTPWGGNIEYCPIYNIREISGNRAISYSAIRIGTANSGGDNITDGVNPSNITGHNLVISF